MMDSTFDDLTPEEQAAVREVSQRLGVEVPAGVMGDAVVDAQGNKIGDLGQWRGLSNALIEGKITSDQITPKGFVTGAISNSGSNSGLAGAESALQAGTTSALATLGQGAEIARDDLSSANRTAQQQIATGKDEIAHAALRTNDFAQNQIRQGMDHVAHAAYKADGLVQNQIRQGMDHVAHAAYKANEIGAQPLRGYANTGQQASAKQAALSGALGGQAQQAAYDEFYSSPGQQYLRDQQEKALLRNSAAIGGLGGGNVRTALQEQAAGIAAQDFANHYARLGELSNRGIQAGQGLSSLAGALGGNVVNQFGSMATQGAGITGSLGNSVVNQFGGLAGQGVGVTGNLGNNVLTQFGSANNLGANLTANTGQNMANIAQNTGLNAANLLSGAGNNLANYRYDTGVNIANSLTNGNSQMATLNQNMGISQADLLGQYTTGLANLLSGTGTQLASGDQALAALIANIATGAGSQYAGLPGIPGVQTGNDHITSGGNLLAGIGAGAEALQGLM